MKRLIFKLFLISIPMMPALIVFVLLQYSGEYDSFDKIHNIQKSNKDILYGPAYFDKDIEYKAKITLLKKPDILALGTSRVMQFDEENFGVSFFNAGGIVSSLTHVPVVLKYFNEHNYKPKKIIIGLDQYFFNAKFDNMINGEKEYYERIHKKTQYSFPFKNVMADLLSGKINKKIFLSNNIGINARQNMNGFKSDGSYYYGGLILYGIEWDKDFSDTIGRIDKGVRRFEYSDEINPIAIQTVRYIVEICKENGIEIIAFIPPYAPTIYDIMKKSGHYSYIAKIMPSIRNIFEDNNFKIYDFSYFPNSTDGEFYDGFHGSTELYKKIAKEIIDSKN